VIVRARAQRVALGWRPLASLMKQQFDPRRRSASSSLAGHSAATPGELPVAQHGLDETWRDGLVDGQPAEESQRRRALRSSGRERQRIIQRITSASGATPIAAPSTSPERRHRRAIRLRRLVDGTGINRADIARNASVRQSTCWTSTRRR
jgi:hypothetical protein